MNKNKCETPLQSVFIINVLFTCKGSHVGWLVESWNYDDIGQFWFKLTK